MHPALCAEGMPKRLRTSRQRLPLTHDPALDHIYRRAHTDCKEACTQTCQQVCEHIVLKQAGFQQGDLYLIIAGQLCCIDDGIARDVGPQSLPQAQQTLLPAKTSRAAHYEDSMTACKGIPTA